MERIAKRKDKKINQKTAFYYLLHKTASSPKEKTNFFFRQHTPTSEETALFLFRFLCCVVFSVSFFLFEAMARRGIDSTLSNIKKMIEDGDYYNAHLTCKSLAFRKNKKKEFSDAALILRTGCEELLKAKNEAGAADLGGLLIRVSFSFCKSHFLDCQFFFFYKPPSSFFLILIAELRRVTNN